MVTKLKNSNYDKTQILKLWANSKTQIVEKLSSASSDSSDSSDKQIPSHFLVLKIVREKNSKSKIVTKPKNSNFDKNQKHKLWQDLKTKILTKLKKQKNCDKTQTDIIKVDFLGGEKVTLKKCSKKCKNLI